jgi:stage II sporulation protein GA (sporulation sigma-E factor processing peptidase)
MPANYIVYGDILLALNLGVDFFLLWATGKFLRRKTPLWRLLLASLLGAVYGVGAVFPSLAFLANPYFAVVFSFLLIRTAFNNEGWRNFAKQIGIFYLISFTLAGAMLGAATFIERQGLLTDPTRKVQVGALLFGIFMITVLAKRSVETIRRSWQKENFLLTIEVQAAGRSCLIKTLIDTGNNLTDPLSGRPVIVAEYKAIASMLPFCLRQAYEKTGEDDPAGVLTHNSIDGWEKRLRLVPFASIGKSHGLLLGFRPDMLVIYEKEEKKTTNEVIICLYRKSFDKEAKYQAIANPTVITAAQKVKLKIAN